MTDKKKELYKWERTSKPRVYSRNQRVTSEDDIQDWIRKVEDASGRATAATFGTKYTSPPSQGYKSSSIATRVEDVHLHDAAYIEAQELLQGWVQDKLDLDAELEYSEENWTQKTESEIKREWDHLLGGDEPTSEATPRSKARIPPQDPYQILREEEDSLVDQVLQSLLNKEVVGEEFTSDLGLDRHDKQKDPRTKMLLRHQQVKENREKREREKKRKLQDQQTQRDAQLQARQILQKEEKAKVLSRKKEEDAIQKEMSKIRKQMEQEKKTQEEAKLKEQRERDEFSRKVKEEMEHQMGAEQRELMKEQRAAVQRGKDVTARVMELSVKEATDNLKLLQRYFSSWYNVVIQRRLVEGKVKATRDWKLLLKTFKAWKSYTIAHQVEREAHIYQQDAKAMQRKQTIAETHSRTKVLRRCFVAWQLYVARQQSDVVMNSAKNQTKNKMAAFLDAAASGKLWSARSHEGHSDRSHDAGVGSGDATDRQVNDMFLAPGRQVAPPGSARSDTSSLNTARTEATSSSRNRNHSDRTKPKQSWQLSRQDVQVTKDDLSRVATKKVAESENPGSESNRTTASTRSRSAFVPNNFENRHAAQQQLLDNQQKQIREQQRLIEEMQYLQKQQLLQQQVTQQQLLRQQLDDAPPATREKPGRGTEAGRGGKKSGRGVGTKITQKTEPPQDHTETTSTATTQNGMVTHRSDTTTLSAATCEDDGKSTVSNMSSSVSVSSKHSKFLKSMEERAAERNRLKQEREEKRRKADEERLMRLQAEEQEKLQQEEDKKRRKMEAYRERKQHEKQLEREKQEQQEKLRHQSAVADEQRRLGLMKYRGFLPWRHLVNMAHKNMQAARDHAERTVLKRVLLAWHGTVSEDLSHKRALADDMHAYILIRRSFQSWKRLGHHMIIQEERAMRHYEVTMKVKVVKAWSDYAAEEKMASWRNDRRAREHNKKRVVLTALRAWRRLPQVLREEEVREQRLTDMRKKVASLLPDFSGTSSVNKTSIDFFS